MRSRYHLIRTAARLHVMIVVIAINLLLLPQYVPYESTGQSHYTVYMNGQKIGVTDDISNIYDDYREARLRLAGDSTEMKMLEVPTFTYEVQDKNTDEKTDAVDSDATMADTIYSMLEASGVKTMDSAYSIKVDDTIVNVASLEEVSTILNEAIDQYDADQTYTVNLVQNNERELNVMTAEIVNTASENAIAEATEEEELLPSAGVDSALEVSDRDAEAEQIQKSQTGFDAYELGVKDIRFSEPIEIVEAYLPADKLSDIDTARGILTQKQETQQIYKVQSGDTLSEISLKVGLPLDEIIALNDELEDENSGIYVDQELIITVPEPELTVLWTVEQRVSESYDLEVQYQYNDSWYTNHSVTIQQPSSGYREAVALVTYENEEEISQEILYEEVQEEAVAKIVEIGTIVPPTYIKPLAGGRLSSGFGRRTAPTAGASTYHKGIDWATPVGTPVYASSGGTVAQAGWGSGYGYVVYINHPDGRQTRYGHLSKIYVSVGQKVTQGQVIAASGNTGRSTGPHVHFEILINGTQVNPLNYLY